MISPPLISPGLISPRRLSFRLFSLRWPGTRRAGVHRLAALACLVTALGPGSPARADSVELSEKAEIRVRILAEGLEHPWGLAFLPDGRMLVSERPGRLRYASEQGLDPRPIEGLPEIAPHGQGGLLDVALHPQFGENRWVYLSYSAAGDGGVGTEIARGRLNGYRLEDLQVLFRMRPKVGTGRHFGSRLVFDRAGFLYVTLGDRGRRPMAQQLDSHMGSVVRLHADGRIPRDNPFVDRPETLPEIFSYGNRNVQGAALHPRTGELWTHEHGPQGGDELNVIRAGSNYGWPVITYGVNYGIGTRIGEGSAKSGMAQPLHYWVPSIAPSGMAFYTGDRFPQWQGDLLIGSLKFRLLVRLELDGEQVVHEERLLQGRLGRIRDVRQGPDGYVYLLTDANRGVLARLEPAD